MRSLLLTGLIFLFVVNLLYGQNFSQTGLEVANHEEVRLVVEDLDQDALDIGLSQIRIESRVNVRMRQVGLKLTTEKPEFLYIRVQVVGAGYNIHLDFNRVVGFFLEDDLYSTYAAVYDKGITGIHGRNPDFIISQLDILLDIFLSDYLDAND